MTEIVNYVSLDVVTVEDKQAIQDYLTPIGSYQPTESDVRPERSFFNYRDFTKLAGISLMGITHREPPKEGEVSKYVDDKVQPQLSGDNWSYLKYKLSFGDDFNSIIENACKFLHSQIKQARKETNKYPGFIIPNGYTMKMFMGSIERYLQDKLEAIPNGDEKARMELMEQLKNPPMFTNEKPDGFLAVREVASLLFDRSDTFSKFKPCYTNVYCPFIMSAEQYLTTKELSMKEEQYNVFRNGKELAKENGKEISSEDSFNLLSPLILESFISTAVNMSKIMTKEALFRKETLLPSSVFNFKSFRDLRERERTNKLSPDEVIKWEKWQKVLAKHSDIFLEVYSNKDKDITKVKETVSTLVEQNSKTGKKDNSESSEVVFNEVSMV